MPANYPASLPVKTTAGANLSTNPHSALHDGMYDEIVAMAVELGTTPKGASVSVKARLDALEPFTPGAWTTWTPTVTQSGAVTVTNTRSRFARYGRTIHCNWSLSVTGTGTASNNIVVSLPVTAAASGMPVGTAYVVRAASGALYPAIANINTTTAMTLITSADNGSNFNLGVVSFTFALASDDKIVGSATYEAAA